MAVSRYLFASIERNKYIKISIVLRLLIGSLSLDYNENKMNTKS